MPRPLFVPGLSLDTKLKSQEATIMIGWYTFLIHFLATFYFLDVYRGNGSDWVPAPTFEYSTDTMYTIALFLAIYSAIYMVVASLGLIRGVKNETRIYYFPWFVLTAIEIMALFYQFTLLWWRYSYDINTGFNAVVIFIVTSYHVYSYLIVLSNYRYLKKVQSPTLIFPQEP